MSTASVALRAVLLATLCIVVAPAASAAGSDDVLAVVQLGDPAIDLHDLAPGDSTSWAAQVTNTSSSDYVVAVSFDSPRTGLLTSDPIDGLQLAVSVCDTALVADGGDDGGADCPGASASIGSGAAADIGELRTDRALPAGGTVGVRVDALFPAGADNRFENADGTLRVTFSVVGDEPAPPGGTPTPTTEPSPEPDPGPGPGDPGDPPGAEPRPDGWLPSTGPEIAATLVGGALAALAGAVLVALARRRERRDALSHGGTS